MSKLPGTPYQLVEVMRNKLLPWVESGAPFILMQPHPREMGVIKVRSVEGELLRAQRGWGTQVREQFWLDQNMNAMSVPYLGCVLEGEADMMVGMTTAMQRKHPSKEKRWVVTLPQSSFFLAPPGVPFSAGTRVHWERPHPENAYSIITWFQIHPAGASYHACACEDGNHPGTAYHVIRDNRLLPVVESIIEEMQTSKAGSLPVAYHYLSILLHYITRGLANNNYHLLEENRESPASAHPPSSSIPTLQRALAFIDMNLNNPTLTVSSIASHVQVSQTHLNRIFRQEMKISVKQHIIKKRHQLACQMLIETSYNVRQVSNYCGYGHFCSFIKSFTQHEGISPLQYRYRHNK